MTYYAIQTNLTAEEIHDKLGFRPFKECITAPFEEEEEQVYIMSIERIELNNDISDFDDQTIYGECEERGLILLSSLRPHLHFIK